MDNKLYGHEPHIDENHRRICVARHRSSRHRRSGCETARRGLVYPISPGLHEATPMFVDVTMRMFLGGRLKKRIEQ